MKKIRLLSHPFILIGFTLVILMIFMAILAPFSLSPSAQDLTIRLKTPGIDGHLLGTDHFGRDILSRLLWGARVSLKVGIVASIISLVIGVILGMISGYVGGKTDSVIMRLTDIMMGFPALLFLIAISAALKPGITTAMMAIGAVSWPGIARLTRSQVLTVMTREYILAGKVMGYSHFRIVLNHIFPNTMAPVIVAFSLGISGAIMAEASLSFLGLGVQPPDTSWGAMINEGKDFLRVAPWGSILPGLAIALSVLGFNLLGEGLRDVMDVKSD